MAPVSDLESRYSEDHNNTRALNYCSAFRTPPFEENDSCSKIGTRDDAHGCEIWQFGTGNEQGKFGPFGVAVSAMASTVRHQFPRIGVAILRFSSQFKNAV